MNNCIQAESPLQPEALALLAQSDVFSQALYPPQSNHLVPAEDLVGHDRLFLVARRAGAALGIGALRFAADHAEVKRMFVAEAARGLRLGHAILAALQAAAAARGVAWLRLETGIHNHAALALYRSAGFVETGPFGEYGPDPVSVFMAKQIAP
jgi:putative acetyltransferase